MISVRVNPDDAVEHIEELKARIFEAVRAGMSQAMVGLAQHVAGNAPVFTGRLVAAILRSPRVKVTQKMIVGSVSGNVGARHVANYLEFGVAAALSKGKLMKFTAADGTLVFTRHRAAIPPRPFMNRSFNEQKEEIVATIAQHVREATR